MMKKCLSLLLALCLGLLAGCGSAPSVDYPELPAVDTGALELESASNSSLKVSFLKADWVAEPNTDPLSVYYRETADSDYTVNVNAQVSQAYDGTLSESDKDDLVDSIAAYNNSANAIGFSVYYYIDQMYSQPGLRLLAVDGVTPSNETIADQSYPLCNEFYAAVRQDSGADTPERKVYDWLSTDAGRACIEKSGYVAVQD